MSTATPIVDIRQISPLILTYLIESLALRGQRWVQESILVSQIASFIAVVSEKQSFAVPARDKVTYAESVNKICGTTLIVIDQLLEAGYIQRMEMEGPIASRAMKNHYQVDIDHEYIKQFATHLGCALKYVSHPAYALENSLLETMKRLQIEERNPLIPDLAPNLQDGAGGGAGPRRAPGSLAPISHVHLGGSEDDRRKWYHIYYHIDGRKTCTCPHFKFSCSKREGVECKHIKSLQDGDYERIEDYHYDSPTQLFNGEMDVNLFTEDVQFVGVFRYRKLEE